MNISFDPAKNQRNIQTRGLLFERAAEFDFATAVIRPDERRAYPEPRFVALGWLDSRLHVLCYSPLPDGIRIISFRKANRREQRDYEATHSTD